ncbi:hypothetical protein DPMN_075059 [Dreissena polymorpha]|uniref:Apple domain-containing protein n=1 Tax=Dreissena polymorpha TaxID=45954 RepID=A0A9D3YKD4_DREPO|nr:hypothetical protein DPMN_075059 [Dreissena polymorpha]
MQRFNIVFTTIGLLAAAVYAQMGNKRMTISYGYVVNSINVAIDSQSMIECAVQCQRQSRKNSCQVAGYNTASRRCQISFASSQDVSPTGDQADVILNMFDGRFMGYQDFAIWRILFA